MKKPKITYAEATFLRESDKIKDIGLQIRRLLSNLEGPNQMHALCFSTAGWIWSVSPAQAFALSEHMHKEIDEHMARVFGAQRPV